MKQSQINIKQSTVEDHANDFTFKYQYAQITKTESDKENQSKALNVPNHLEPKKTKVKGYYYVPCLNHQQAYSKECE